MIASPNQVAAYESAGWMRVEALGVPGVRLAGVKKAASLDGYTGNRHHGVGLLRKRAVTWA